MQPRSESLFHFTKTMDVLQSILINGFWPRYCIEDVQWQNYPDVDFVAFPMVCFCDIPISRISDHVKFYGKFGLGLTKEWAIKNNLNPVFYFAKSNELHNSFQKIINLLEPLKEPEKTKRATDVRHILAHSKPIKGRMLVNGKHLNKDFYQESEWRYVPKHEKAPNLLRMKDHETSVEKYNEMTRTSCLVKFEPKDVQYIFVPADQDIPEIIDFITSKLSNFSARDLKILTSRVTSLENINRDM
ncbi:hypothetical protein GCM10009091_49110 [Pseudomonas brenneri]|uniref:Abortive phage resistance protein AbiGi, antitoxin n=1 Tax=Pseudomonas brenneri TaxID=129817 RepID=A0A5B2UIU6_9PSED|nr:abortive infection system antitoxin AbiGi family protein [Pseudomonas brenneri]KAA2226753.1 hypothetical protein F1720_25100 [Pseudomonas brenneri]TWR74844.1 hypothetical protein FJD34_25165 [Pseudomonas brenneri]GGL61586.1 hypothetical protein GCM10009091_49110 [Pseudomonas brenneri]SDU90702.1 Putative abortive phage resistance protein AbiGi, antitoxin [Pseudomonas brenneri]